MSRQDTIPDDFPADVPAAKLRQLMETTDDMLVGALRRDRDATLATVARHAHDLLEAESCAIFLVSEQDRDRLTLEAALTDTTGPVIRPGVSLRIRSVPGESLTGHLACVGKIVRLREDELRRHEYRAGKRADHLAGGNCLSLLSIPLKDRRGRLLGMVKLENKKSGGRVGRDASFDLADEWMARILANKIVLVLETLRNSEAFRGLVRAIQTTHSRDELSKTVLERAMALVRADRADLALWSEAQHNLVVAAQFEGLGGSCATKLGGPAPTGVVRGLWDKPEAGCRIVDDTTLEQPYFPCDPRTRSEIAIVLRIGAQPIGVLNLESFKRHWFDRQDGEVLELLAEYVAPALQLTGTPSPVGGPTELGRGQARPPAAILRSTLTLVQGIGGFEGGLIYIADHEARVLHCEAYHDLPEMHPERVDHQKFIYKFSDRSAATKVLNERTGYYSADPNHDPEVNPAGLAQFRIKGPLVAVPLIHRGIVVGVLVVWSRHNRPPVESDIESLQPFAQFAAATIARSGTGPASAAPGREAAPRARPGGVRDADGAELVASPAPGGAADGAADEAADPDEDEEKHLARGFLGLTATVFDRARIYKYEPSERQFVCVGSLDGGRPDRYVNYRIGIDSNPYARHAAETCLKNPGARKYDPTDHTLFGPCPDCTGLDKPSDLPWAVVPLLVEGELYGQITADNRLTGNAITGSSLEYLTLLATVLSLSLSRARQAASQRALQDSEALYHSLVENIPQYIFRKDLQGRFTFANTNFCKLLQKSGPGEVIGKTDFHFYPAPLAEEYRRRDREVMDLDAKVDVPEEVHVLPDGTRIFVHVVKTPVHDSNGNVIGVQAIFWDITKLKQAEEDRVALKAKDVLLAEVHHRFGNHLGNIARLLKRGAARLQQGTLDVGRAAEAFNETRQLLRAITLLHIALSRTEGYTQVNLADYVRALAENVLKSYPDSSRVTCRVEVEADIFLDGSATTCGLIITELISNAMKYAFPNEAKGVIHVSVRRVAGSDTAYELTVSDDGVGLPGSGAPPKGMGIELVTGLAHHLGGTIQFCGGPGTTVTVIFHERRFKRRE